MKKVYSFLFALMAISMVTKAQSQLGELRGKIIDGTTKKPLDYANIQLELNGIIKAQAQTDDEGDFIIKPLQPGNYTLKVSYVGYANMVITDVDVISDQITKQDITMQSTTELREVKIVRKKPLINPGGTSGMQLGSKEIMRLPQRSVNSIANLTAGVDSRSGRTPNIRGARADGTAYYIDGVRVQGGASVTIPQNAIDQIQVITSGTPAQYGDFTGGAITINTKMPSKNWIRTFEVITASPFYKWTGDNSHYNEIQGFVSGPIMLANKGRDNERVLIGFSLAARGQYALDGSLPAVDLYRAKPSVQASIEATPLTRTVTGGFVPSGEYLVKSDFEKVDQKQNSGIYSGALQGNFSYQPANNISIRVGYMGNFSRYRDFSFYHSLLNSDNNQLIQDFTGRVFGQFTQTFAKTGEEAKKPQTITGFYYTARVSYETRFVESMNAEFQRDFFKYGHVGKFQTYSAQAYTRIQKESPNLPDSFATGRTGPGDTIYLMNYVRNVGLQDTAYTFQPSQYNPVKANYTKTIYDYYASQGQTVRSFSQLSALGGLLNGAEPPAIYSLMWGSPGALQANYFKQRNETYSLYLMSEASVAPRKNPKAKHDLQFGFTYEQQSQRFFSVGAAGLWTIARQYANTQFQGLSDSLYTLKFDDLGNFQDTVFFADQVVENEQSSFDKRLRQKLIDNGATDAYGNPIGRNTRIDVNSLDPSMYSLDMFTADELLNNGSSVVSYYGYDHTGNRVNGKKNISDFLDNSGRYLGAYQPVYMAAWLQDQFVFKDLIVRAGVRFDRFDANQSVLKDPYTLVPVYTAGEIKGSSKFSSVASQIPGSIGDDYVVYVDTKTPNATPSSVKVTGFRKGNDWFDATGNPVTDPATLWRNSQRENIQAPSNNIPFLVTDNQIIPTASSFRDYKPDVKVSPRIWFSFPISTTSQFFGTYDVLVQRPTERNIGQIDDYYYLTNRQATIANPDLKMTQVTDYEIGFRQQVGDNSAIGLVASYREFRNLIQLYRYAEAYPRAYSSYGNLDFSTVKSFRIEYELRDLGNVNLSANYMLQFADGTGSNATSSNALVQVGLPSLRSVFPMDFDTRHTLKGTIDYHYRTGKDYDGPIVNGKKILEEAGINFIFNYTSGRPYTQTLIPISEVQAGVATRTQVKGTINGANLPPQFYLDMNIDKWFTFKKEALNGKVTMYRLRVFIWVQNLLNAANVNGVYRYSGSAYDDGFLASPQSQESKRSATNGQSFVDLYNIKVVNPDLFALPRLTRLGVSLNF
ncbi:MAG: carboxypeptidase regulatory-like domain-containing protein [Bacteroidota bacterium]